MFCKNQILMLYVWIAISLRNDVFLILFYFILLLLKFWSVSWVACPISWYDTLFFFPRVHMAYLCMENTFTIKLFESNHFNNLQRNYGHIGWFNVNNFLDALCLRCSQVGLGWIYAQLAIDPIRSHGEKLDLVSIGRGN